MTPARLRSHELVDRPLDLFPNYRPRATDTPEGRVWARLIARFGFVRVAKHAPRINQALKNHARPTQD